jgi:thiamine-monophosphate kinase
MTRLRDHGEDAVVARLTSLLSPGGKEVLAGPGDDCAVVAGARRGEVTLLKTDCLVEGVHYTMEAPARQVGWKAVARVVSDFAAMGGEPSHLLVTVALPPERDLAWAENLYRGIDKCAVRFGASVVGGETSSLPPGAPGLISVAATGRARRRQLVLRSGGRSGDELFVTGRLGGSLAGRHLRFVPRLEEALWLTKHFPVHAMMDLSDGLAADLPRLAAASSCGYLLDRAAVPRSRGAGIGPALGDGEDYELLLAVSKRTGRWMTEEWAKRFPKLKLTRIGGLCPGVATPMEGGWEHFGTK